MTYNEIHGFCDFHKFYQRIFNQLPSGAAMVEVGVWLGHSVAYMASLAKEAGKDITIHCVDTFEGSIEHKKLGLGNFRERFIQNMSDCGVLDMVRVIPYESAVAVRGFEYGSLDFVFLDGAHDYRSVMEDIKLWKNRLKTGGILAGHDYCESWPGVVRAVDESFKFKKKINVDKSVWWIEHQK